ncbi:MAG: peptide deformylase [Pseudomonadota bacterium]
MTLLKILNYPNPRLKTKAQTVEDVHNEKVQQMIADMLETLQNTPHCGGLAASQLDIAHPLRIFVFYDSEDSSSNPTCIVNPEVIKTEGEVFEEEGCMSVYSDQILAKVKRPQRTTIKGLDTRGETIEMAREGYLAKLFVHECDHLDGKLYIDYLKPLKRKLIEKKIAKVVNNHKIDEVNE